MFTMYVKACLVDVNKCMELFYLEQPINIVNRVTLQMFWFIFSSGYGTFPSSIPFQAIIGLSAKRHCGVSLTERLRGPVLDVYWVIT